MNTYRTQYRLLSHFLGGYFHLDWQVVYDWQGTDPQFTAVVRHYVAECRPQTVAQTIAQLEDLLALPLDDQTLAQVVTTDLMLHYRPQADGLTHRQWLERVLQVLRLPPDPKWILSYR